jgi:hypothetical protein
MTYRGTVRSNVVVLLADVTLPDGAEVVVSDERSTSPAGRSIWEKLCDLGQWAETLPTDLSTNHDHYLHGLPKRS